jgi:ribonuclease HI
MGEYLVFTDGAARRNPGPGGWGVVILTPEGEVVELGGRAGHTTNNKMEMTAAIEALRFLGDKPGRIELCTDSTYLIRGVSEWIRSWRRRGWKTMQGQDVLNRDLWERLSDLTAARGPGNEVRWRHVRGHAGVPGNERADEIATGLADLEPVGLYQGPAKDYDRDLRDLPDPAARSERAPSRPSRSKGKPYSYLSVVDGRPMRHTTWAECESRVKGTPGARFKKAMSASEEKDILASWGFSPVDLPPPG